MVLFGRNVAVTLLLLLLLLFLHSPNDRTEKKNTLFEFDVCNKYRPVVVQY